jgi:ATP phosphoribosyltransferase regulatory subunit
MSTTPPQALLPAGISDVLPPDAAVTVATIERILACFGGHGFERVEPPLIEFEDGLLAGSGVAMTAHTFRLMDPVSQRMMAVRPDMTLQVARIATTRLAHWPRPLRLSYAGPVLRVRGSQRRPERQFGQVGAELIGAHSPDADVELILMALEALAAAGISGLSVDIGLPTLVPALTQALAIGAGADTRLRQAFDRKDAVAVAAAAPKGHAGALLSGLLDAAGPAEEALARLDALDFPPLVAPHLAELGAVARRVRAAAPDLPLTVDPVEHRGYEYHTGVTYTFFAPGPGGEIGRGGRYQVGDGESAEPATGLTLFADALMRILPDRPKPRRVWVPAGTPSADAKRLRDEGWVTVAGLETVADPAAEARRMRCQAMLTNGRAQPV